LNHTFANSEISNWYFNKDKSSLLVEFRDGKIAKIGSGKHPRKNHTLMEEFDVLKKLSDLNCQSCPKPFEAMNQCSPTQEVFSITPWNFSEEIKNTNGPMSCLPLKNKEH
jgi:hypothetical protein